MALSFTERPGPFLFAFLVAITMGIFLHFLTQKDDEPDQLTRKDAYFIVTLSWFLISLVGCLPYIFSGSIPSFINALFESVSGFTTTGSSILTDIESLPKSILFWRSLTHWIGGIGIIVLVILVMPVLQIGGYHLFTMESSMQEKIFPKTKSLGYRLLFIYLALTFIEILLLLLGGMNLYESVCHAFGTIATGGFSPKNDSIAGYSPYIQYIVMLFMLLSGMNFVIHFFLVNRNFKKIRSNEELKFYLSGVILIGLFMTLTVSIQMGKPLEVSVREGFFQVISILTCTGYVTADYLQWPAYAWVILFFAMFMGGSTGSTAGGIKLARHLILYKNISRTFRRLISPNAVLSIRLNRNAIEEDANTSILTFIFMYITLFIFGTILLVMLGIDWTTAGGSAATCMAGIGPGIGTVGPTGNFAHLPDLAKIILTLLMLLGRLEIYTILILFTRNFWKI
ncbi:MAG: TrkH family potassium uptake protein [Bacteroidales bacterium]|nr:TrkH family potassium uptake protein [Bacteroidales bacterium]